MRWAVVLALLVPGCGTRSDAEPAPAAPLEVELARAWVEETDAVHEAAGTVRALRSAELSSKVMGRVLRVNVSAGALVKAGQLLAVIDDGEARAGQRQAQAELSQAERGLEQAIREVAAAQARAEMAAATYRRYQRLLEDEAVARQAFEEIRASHRQALAGHAAARAARERARAQVAQARAGLAGSRAQFGHTRITAPFDGRVVQRQADPGDLASPGTPLLVVEQRRPLRVEATVSESLAGQVRLGDTVEVEVIERGQVTRLSGRITELVPSVTVPARTFLIKVDLPGDTPDYLHSGTFARVRLRVGKQQKLLIPDRAVTRHGQLDLVYVVEKGRALLRLVTLGQQVGDRVEVLSGLRRGESVVLGPRHRLRDGIRVSARAGRAPPAPQ